jgi:2-polyprenyl-3-methyl-5-hydroxy-6-metoxy-1,4-benzoquinol methylase
MGDETMTDCFGLDISDEEFENWQKLTTGGFDPPGIHLGFTIPRKPLPHQSFEPNPEFHDRVLPLPSEDLTGLHILELGCAAGKQAGEIVCRGGTYVGIDISHHCIACSRAAYNSPYWHGLTFLHTIDDRETILAMAGTFDVVFGANFFIHQPTERIAAQFTFAAQMLKAGGTFSVDRRIGKMADFGPEQKGIDWQGFKRTREEEAALLAECGFVGLCYHVSALFAPHAEPTREYVLARKA